MASEEEHPKSVYYDNEKPRLDDEEDPKQLDKRQTFEDVELDNLYAEFRRSKEKEQKKAD